MNNNNSNKRNVISHFGGSNGYLNKYKNDKSVFIDDELKLPKLKDPTLIENRLPNIVFTGELIIINRKEKIRLYIFENDLKEKTFFKDQMG